MKTKKEKQTWYENEMKSKKEKETYYENVLKSKKEKQTWYENVMKSKKEKATRYELKQETKKQKYLVTVPVMKTVEQELHGGPAEVHTTKQTATTMVAQRRR